MRFLFFHLLFLTLSVVYAQEDIKLLEQQINANPDDLELLLKLGIAYHDKAENGDKNAMRKCEDILSQILERDENNYLALAYLGSILTMKGRQVNLLWQKIKYVKQGIEKIDKAVDIQPDNLRVRLVRAINSLNLPSFFYRLKNSLEDFAYIITSKEFKKLSIEDQSMVYYNFGMAWEKDGNRAETQKNFELAIQVASESTWGQKAKQELKTLQ